MSYKYLVIVESPAKARTINRYLGKDYKVVASKGHLRDLPKSRMGVDLENNYEPHYISIRGRGDTIRELRKLAKKADQVYLAADPDREGEAIAWHLTHLLKLDLDDKNRIVFNEITKQAILDAFEHPQKINNDRVDAQQARRILDRVVGYSISPLIWRKIKRGLSAGRVQSVVLKMIIDRENEIKAFVPQEYWSIPSTFKKGEEVFETSFYGIDGKKTELPNEEAVKAVTDRLDQSAPFQVANVKEGQRRRRARAPFTTSTLQQEGSNRLGFSTSKTMRVAQQLYEGVTIGGRSTGLITYMRTDSTRISPLARHMANEYIEKHFGESYKGSNRFTSGGGDQDAHEAVRPTNISLTPEKVKNALDLDQFRLYSLIWSRFMASQMADAVYETVRADIEQNGVTFRANGSRIKFDGFLKVFPAMASEDNILPVMVNGDTVTMVTLAPEQHFTQPPPRYNEASLVRTLEEKGIGRPSTYSPTIETLRRRNYVEMEERRFHPTELGGIVNDMMTEYFPQIVDEEFTADMEDKLDEVEKGKEDWVKVIDSFYQPFATDLEKAESNMKKVEIKDEPAGFDCEKCGSPMVIKDGRYGKFYACSNFPDCRNTQAIVKKIGVKCPKCEKGQVVERKSRRGRIFYGCDQYPECDFVSWNKPIDRFCPKCEHILMEKRTRRGTQVLCSDCDYKEDLVPN